MDVNEPLHCANSGQGTVLLLLFYISERHVHMFRYYALLTQALFFHLFVLKSLRSSFDYIFTQWNEVLY